MSKFESLTAGKADYNQTFDSGNRKLQQGEDILIRYDTGGQPVTGDIKIGHNNPTIDQPVTIEDVTVQGSGVIQAPAPAGVGVVDVVVAGVTADGDRSDRLVGGGEQVNPNKTPAERGYRAGSNFLSFTDPTTMGEFEPLDDPITPPDGSAFKFAGSGMWAGNQNGEINPGEDVILNYNTGTEIESRTGDITIGGETVAEDVTLQGRGKIQVPAPNKTGTLRVLFADRYDFGAIRVHPGDQDTPNRSPSERGFVAGSDFKSFTNPSTMNDWEPRNDPVETPDAEPEIDPADQPGLVHADNEQGYALAPNFRGVYESAQSLLSDAQDGTLDKLNRSSDESSQSSPSPPSPSSSTGSTTTSGGLSRQVVVGAVVAVVAGAAALLGGN